MSFTNLRYDECDYRHQLQQSTDPLRHILDPIKYENCKPCRMELGIVGGNNVSLPRGNLVDVDSELKGITRTASRCAIMHYNNPCAVSGNFDKNQSFLDCQANRRFNNNDLSTLDYQKRHLPPCMMTKPPRPSLPEPLRINSCGCKL